MVQSFQMNLVALSAFILICWASPQSELYENFRTRDAAPATRAVKAWRDSQESQKQAREQTRKKLPITTPGGKTSSPNTGTSIGTKTNKNSSRVPKPRVTPTRVVPVKKNKPAAPGIDGSAIPSRIEF